jgi:hypothetical protein
MEDGESGRVVCYRCIGAGGCTLVSQWPPSCFGGTPHHCYLIKDVQPDTTLLDIAIHAHHTMLDESVMPWLCNIAPNQ